MRCLEVGGYVSRAVICNRGAYLLEWSVSGKDIILPGDPDRPTWSGIAIMIPFANRVRDGEYEFEGIKYSLPRNKEGHAIHGLVLNEEWSVTSTSENSISLKHVLNHPGYPTELTSMVKYALVEGGLDVEFIVKNTGLRGAPLVVGAHPYFIASNDWRINTQGKALMCETINKIPTGKLIPFNLNIMGRREFDDCFLINGDITLESQHSAIKIIRQGMPYVQIFTGVPNAIAIEPMSGTPDAYHNGMGLTIIRPGEEKAFSFAIRVLRA
ncbi:aldose 1-epimerase [Vulcanisaeta souniana]|uniref:Aldose epimerase n=1 Tax=Vulcanisaeta souniana JCM 11219 TaxID=1293586 RepID=A0A830E9J0_9CREN|nr:aldose 1-epimerase [Vulcanisaeta souniana]BDR93489.1 aldose epimerase [Vulcanisaeta souniana JCM 11219]GGI77536.1 aldose epimerase [Vulcanisaeta souniana JCM 11219]